MFFVVVGDLDMDGDVGNVGLGFLGICGGNIVCGGGGNVFVDGGGLEVVVWYVVDCVWFCLGCGLFGVWCELE